MACKNGRHCSIEANPSAPELRGLLAKKQDLMRRLAAAR
jgi:hypothetical protein